MEGFKLFLWPWLSGRGQREERGQREPLTFTPVRRWSYFDRHALLSESETTK